MDVVSLSGGKDSTAMLLYMLEHDMNVDEIIFCDTGVEFPEIYEHLDKLEAYTGRKITRLKPPHPFEYYLCEHVKTRGASPGAKGYGWPGPLSRWCTGLLKTRVFSRYLAGKKYVRYIGIAYDEGYRLRRKDAWKKGDCRYPLVEAQMTERDCLEYCYSKGFDFGGLYRFFRRLGCYLCPLQSVPDLRRLYWFYPDLFKEIVRLQELADANGVKTKFRKEFTIQEAAERFEKEGYYYAL